MNARTKNSNADYQRIQAISSHWLISCLHSPAECFRKHLDPNRPTPESTASLRLGTAVHGLALTPHQFEREIIVMDYERRSKAGKAHYAELIETGKTVLKPAELERAQAIVAALKAHKAARRLLLHGKKERTIIQPRSAGMLPLKGRLDVHHEASRTVVELKTTRDINLAALALRKYSYLISAAFYQRLAQAQSVVMVFVQSTEPHDVLIVPLERSQLQEGREQYQAALSRFDACWQSGVWPEAEPLPAFDDDDDLMMPIFQPMNTRKQRNTSIDVGELVL